MRTELDTLGHVVNFVAVNIANAESTQQSLVAKCSFPLFQDTAAGTAWSIQGGAKDDLFIYDAKRKLTAHLPYGGAVNMNLSTPDGYANVKNAILSALGSP